VFTYKNSLQPTILNDNVNQFKVGLESGKGYFTLKVKTMTLISHIFARNSNYVVSRYMMLVQIVLFRPKNFFVNQSLAGQTIQTSKSEDEDVFGTFVQMKHALLRRSYFK
jgi:hypothetical protein